jgi:sterol desaturase/sphingolipid hydroxylase (fatty acid hydroxylase superfamily)
MDKMGRTELQSKLLDTATASVVVGLLYYKPELFNPWQLEGWQWLAGAAVIRAAITFYDHLVIFVVDRLCQHNLLPTRTTPGKPVRYVSLDTKSIVFLTINAVHEWIFVQRLCHFIWYSPSVPLHWQEIGIVNTVGALWIMFPILDLCYAPCHHLLHMPWCYPLIHKHHHRQHFPTRGYLDAGNEHPIEHVIGVACTWGAVLAAVHGPTGAHGLTLFLFFNLHAALAMLNHSPYNVKFNIIPGVFHYSVANHEMHHRKFTINYAQYCLWYDHVMKTYGSYDYEGLGTTKEL